MRCRRHASLVRRAADARLAGDASAERDHLTAALELAERLAQAEPETTAWFAIKIDPSTFAIADFFPAAAGRQAHLDGPIAAALMKRANELLACPPDIKPVDVLAAKLPT